MGGVEAVAGFPEAGDDVMGSGAQKGPRETDEALAAKLRLPEPSQAEMETR